MRIYAQVAVITAVALSPQILFAQTAAPARTSSPRSGDQGEARKRYEIGLKLYDENNWEAARIEFERAYQLSPTPRILYNIGLVYRQLNNYTASLAAFERYLSEGGSEIPPDRKAEVEKEIAELGSRVGRVRISTNVAGAEILVDDLSVGRSPLETALRVNPGVRKFSVQARGHMPTSKTLPIYTGDNPELMLELVELPRARVDRSNPWTIPTIAGWSVTGLALGATVVTGVLALGAQSDQEGLIKKNGVTRPELDDARDKTTTLSGLNTAFLAGTIAFGGLSTIFTLKMINWKPSKEEDLKPDAPRAVRPARFAIVPAGLGVGAVGTF